MQKRIYFFLFCLTVLTVGWCIYRDIHIEKGYTGDLRNRIVGARLQKDNHPPYFYKWKNGEGLRYYDPQNFDTLKVSNITATPFFHQLLYPLAGLQQRAISRIWLCLEYFLWLMMTAIALFLAKSRQQKIAVIIITTIFLFTNAWTGHVAAGQLYLIIPFLALLFYSCVVRNTKRGTAIIAGVCAAALVLIRPNTIFFLLPFLFFIHWNTFKHKIFFFVPALLTFVFEFNSARAIAYWNDYRLALAEQLRSHQHLHPAVQRNDPDPAYTNWEGWDTKQVARDAKRFPYSYNEEHGNIFVLINYSFQIRTPVWLLIAGFIFFMLMVLYFYFKKNKPSSPDYGPRSAILAFCIYMGSDIFSPIHRFQYNATQWLFALLLAASVYHPRHKWVYAGIISGLILNSVNLSFIVMEQTLGEYLVFLSLLFLVISRQSETIK